MSTSAQTATRPKKTGPFAQLARMPRAFWMVNVMETIERLAYYGVRVVVPIYIAQADEPGGLHFTQPQKAVIYAWWAAVQAGVPIFSGGFADRLGYKKTIAFATTITILGYILMATQRMYLPFLLGACTVGLGTAFFKPGLQGTLVRTLDEKTSSVGWGTFYMVVNIGGFLGPPLAHFLKGMSWSHVFFGSAIILSLNFLMLLTYPAVSAGGVQRGGPLDILKRTLRNLGQPKLISFILIMSGFWLMFMQLFDLLPNFIVDWVDSRALVQALHLPSMFTTATARGTMLAQEWLVNVDAGLIVLCVLWISWLASRMKRVQSIFIGIVIASIGLLMAGFSMSGWMCFLGIAVFAVGEMLSSPKMNEYLGVIAPEGQKALYMGYANMPFAIGWVVGSLAGGSLYEKLGEKATLALRYLEQHGGVPQGIERTSAMEALQASTGLDPNAATRMLWETYRPYRVWLPFVGLGILAAVGIWLYSRWIAKDEKVNV
ncbi:MAG: MFS transporter [Candidatus Eisenbacteria bacterium]|nr:MFS transporter [Candidatus Eisenbacteria bacterium]